MKITRIALIALAASIAFSAFAAKPSYADITWMSIANMYYEIGGAGIITDGYFTRVPQDQFYGGGGGLARTRMAFKPDVEAVTRVLTALGGGRGFSERRRESRVPVQVIKPLQYMDKWRLDRGGVRPIDNTTIKRLLGF